MALSSAEGHFIPITTAHSDSSISIIDETKTLFQRSVKFFPFTKDEYLEYKVLADCWFPPDDTVYEMTGYNPKLLEAIVRKIFANIKEIDNAINAVVMSNLQLLQESAMVAYAGGHLDSLKLSVRVLKSITENNLTEQN